MYNITDGSIYYYAVFSLNAQVARTIYVSEGEMFKKNESYSRLIIFSYVNIDLFKLKPKQLLFPQMNALSLI